MKPIARSGVHSPPTSASSRVAIAVYASLALAFTFSPDASACGECKRLKKAVKTAATQASTNIESAAEKVKTETTNFGENVEEAGREYGRYVRRQAEMYGDIAAAVKDGQLNDAQKIYFRRSYEDSIILMQESSMIRTGAMIVATAYGTPYSAGAFSYVMARETNGDNSDAWRAGFVTAGAAFLGGKISSQPMPIGGAASSSTVTAHVASKAVASGMVNCTANAMLSDDKRACEKGFERGAIASLAASYAEYVTLKKPDSKWSEGSPHSKIVERDWATEQKSQYLRGLDTTRPMTGTENPSLNPPATVAAAFTRDWNAHGFSLQKWDWSSEHSGLMLVVNKVPTVQYNSVFHDNLATMQEWGSFMTVATIPPAFVVGAAAQGVPQINLLQESATDKTKKSD